MTPKLQAMLARVEAMEADLKFAIECAFSYRIINPAAKKAQEARAEFNRAVREESEREANRP